MSVPRYKQLDEFTPDELVEFTRNGTVPERMSEEEEAALREAGFDPETKRPLGEVEAERAKTIAREKEIKRLEEMTVEEHYERIRAEREGTGSL